jgi:hypothetical protein
MLASCILAYKKTEDGFAQLAVETPKTIHNAKRLEEYHLKDGAASASYTRYHLPGVVAVIPELEDGRHHK